MEIVHLCVHFYLQSTIAIAFCCRRTKKVDQRLAHFLMLACKSCENTSKRETNATKSNLFAFHSAGKVFMKRKLKNQWEPFGLFASFVSARTKQNKKTMQSGLFVFLNWFRIIMKWTRIQIHLFVLILNIETYTLIPMSAAEVRRLFWAMDNKWLWTLNISSVCWTWLFTCLFKQQITTTLFVCLIGNWVSLFSYLSNVIQWNFISFSLSHSFIHSE